MSFLSYGKLFSGLGKLTVKSAKTADKVVSTAGKVGLDALRHPGKAAIEGFGIYSGWNYLTKGKTMAESGKDVLDKGKEVVFGKDNAAKVQGTIDAATGTVRETRGLLSDIQHTKEGIANTLQGLFSGNGSNVLGEFMKNLFSGNVKGIDLTMLVAGGWMLLSRHTHMLGKLTGAMLAMSAIGNNAGLGLSASTPLRSAEGLSAAHQDYSSLSAVSEENEHKGIHR